MLDLQVEFTCIRTFAAMNPPAAGSVGQRIGRIADGADAPMAIRPCPSPPPRLSGTKEDGKTHLSARAKAEAQTRKGKLDLRRFSGWLQLPHHNLALPTVL